MLCFSSCFFLDNFFCFLFLFLQMFCLVFLSFQKNPGRKSWVFRKRKNTKTIKEIQSFRKKKTQNKSITQTKSKQIPTNATNPANPQIPSKNKKKKKQDRLGVLLLFISVSLIIFLFFCFCFCCSAWWSWVAQKNWKQGNHPKTKNNLKKSQKSLSFQKIPIKPKTTGNPHKSPTKTKKSPFPHPKKARSLECFVFVFQSFSIIGLISVFVFLIVLFGVPEFQKKRKKAPNNLEKKKS